jgi:hypothetical protein
MILRRIKMEAAETTKIEALIERFDQFQADVKALQQKPAGLSQELSVKRGKLERLKAGRISNLAQEELGKAEILEKQIMQLEPEIEILEAKISAFGPGGKNSAQAIVASTPDSKLFKEAASIAQQASEIVPTLEGELKEFMSFGVDAERERYLKVIEDFSEKLLALWQISRAGIFCGTYLPEELRSGKPPRLVAPEQGHFEIDASQIATVYRRLSKTAFLNV